MWARTRRGCQLNEMRRVLLSQQLGELATELKVREGTSGGWLGT